MLIKFFKYIIHKNDLERRKKIAKGVKHSLQKYEQTYKLLEQYDKQVEKSPELLANPGRLQPIIRNFQKSIRIQ